MRAVGYIRQSRRADLDVALSYDSQLNAIRRMAERDGIDPEAVTILADMGRSGGSGKERQRAAYQELLAGIADGSIGTIYALSMSRLARSVKELLRVYEAAADHGIRIVYDKEGEARFDTPDGKMRATILAAVYEFERDLSVERARDNVRIRRARGDQMGRIPYGSKPGEDPEVVADAYRATGSLNGAAMKLNADGLPSPLGRLWSGTGVRMVLQRHAPEILPRRTTKGAKPSAPFYLYRLLRCHCGRLLTASRDLRQPNKQIVYRCHAASVIPDHGPYRLTEGAILPWVKAEAARLRTPDGVQLGERNAERRAELEEDRRRLGVRYQARELTDDEYHVSVGSIDSHLEGLIDQEQAVEIPAIDWTWPAKELNAALRALWEYIELDATMRPVRAKWRVAEWRA
jgi:DNA invertase Pin-like site-specific DNA recombinase